jgi:phytoene dehydrogenase-like protein
METYDAVCIGSGHNALIAAALLARAGWSVLVLERNDRPGGLVRTEELTLPGFLHDTFSTAHPLLLAGPAFAELWPELAERGLRYVNTDIPTGVSLPDGRTSVLSTSFEANVAEAERLAPGDGSALAQLMEEFGPVAEPVFQLFGMDLASPEATALIERVMLGQGGRGYSEFAQTFALTARDLLEQRFRSPVLRAMLAPWALHLGRGPEDATGGLWLILVLAALGQAGMPIPEGGSERLAHALVRLLADRGGAVRCDCPVERVVVEGGRATGVRVAGGETIRAARAVIASVNPDQLYLRLLAGVEGVPESLTRQAGRFRYGRGCVQVHLALAEPPRFADERLARAGQPHLTTGLDGVSRAVNEAQRGLLPAEPTISFDVPSTLDPSRCPEGRAVARLQMLEVPTRPRGDAAGEIEVGGDGAWTDALKEAFADRVIALAGRHAPNLPGAVLGRRVIGPDDLARFNPNCGPGDPYGGSHDLSQSYLFRPLPGQPSHRTSIGGLFVLGAATWPGHGVNGGSGYIVATQLLREGAGG